MANLCIEMFFILKLFSTFNQGFKLYGEMHWKQGQTVDRPHLQRSKVKLEFVN